MVIQLPEIAAFTWILGGGNNPTTHPLAAFFLLTGTLWLIAKLTQSYTRSLSLPPGPKGLPFIGDFLHAADQTWLASPQRKNDYGDIPYPLCLINHAHACSGEMMYISVLGKGMLIINSQRVAVDLLEKRSNISSDRPHYISAGDFLTKNLSFTLTPYGDLYHVSLFPSCIQAYLNVDYAVSDVSPQKAFPNWPFKASIPSRIAKRSCWHLH